MNTLFLLLNYFTFVGCTTYSIKPINKLAKNSTIETGYYDLEFLLNFTSCIQHKHGFNTFVIFNVNHEDYREKYALVPSLEQRLMKKLQIPLMRRQLNNISQLRYVIGLKNLIFIFISSVNDPILEVVSHTLKGIHNMPMIFIYKTINQERPSMEEIHKFFEWCWQENILNVALTFQVIDKKWNNLMNSIILHIKNEVFKYTPYPEITIYNVTDQLYGTKGNFIKEYTNDVQGYLFKTPMFEDIPNVFLSSRIKSGSKLIPNFVTGTAGRTFHEYIQFVNGTFELQPFDTVGYYHFQKETLTYAARKLIDIGIHPYSPLLPYANLTEGSYPIASTNACIIVPFVPEIAHGQYIIRVIPVIIWLIWLIELLSLCIIQFIHLRRFDMGNGLIYSLRTLLGQSLNVREFQQRRFLLKTLHVFVVLLSVLVNSSFNASMASMLSTTLGGKQITTINDLLASGLQIITTQAEKEVYFDSNLFPETLKPILNIVTESELMEHKDKLNTSFAYVLNNEEWDKYNFQQQLMSKSLLRLAHPEEMCSGKQFLRFPIQWDSPFAMSLERFIMYAADTGLRQAWQNWSIYLGTIVKQIQNWKSHKSDVEPLKVEFFSTIFIVYTVMMSLAIICFMAELMWFKRRKIFKRFYKLRIQDIATEI